MRWTESKALKELHEKIADMIALHGFSVTSMRLKGVSVDSLSESERTQFIKNFELNGTLAGIGDRCDLLSQWCAKAATGIIKGPSAAWCMSRDVRNDIESLTFRQGSSTIHIVERVKKFLAELEGHLAHEYPDEVLAEQSAKTAPGIDLKNSADVIEALIKQSDQRAAMLGAKSLKNLFAGVEMEAKRRGLRS